MDQNLRNNVVALNILNQKTYPATMPFDPPVRYPEYTGRTLDPENHIYAGVRDLLWRLGLDHLNFNTKEWNPFGEIIKPGMTVFIKPNLVSHVHEEKRDVFSVIVHASVLRPILDYVCIALKSKGKIIIGDSPLISSNFNKALEVSRIKDLLDWYRTHGNIPIEYMDLRKNRGVRTWLYGKWGRKPVEQDPLGYQFVNLGDQSCFNNVDPAKLRIAIASHRNMYKHHSNGRHEYLFPKSFLQSDVVISIPKLKTHRRTGITLALKNSMGIPAWKDSLPHFMVGSKEDGGDQYIHPSVRKRMCTWLHDQVQSNRSIPVKFFCAVVKKLLWNSNKIYPFQDDVYEAMWYGNDTLWRTLLDINRAVFYADKDGNLQGTQQRKFFCLIDGIIAGEGNGPLSPNPVRAGALIAGFHPAAVDAVAATIMGFDIEKIPLIKRAFEENGHTDRLYPGAIKDIQIIKDENRFNFPGLTKHLNLKFEPHPNWKGHIELH
jgi:uncharacterized protein (DUF362 family)